MLRTLAFCYRLFALALLRLSPWVHPAFFLALEVGSALSHGLIRNHQFGIAAAPLPILASFEVSYQLVRSFDLRYFAALSEILNGQLPPALAIFSGRDDGDGGVAAGWGRG